MTNSTTWPMHNLRTAAVLLTLIFGLTACDNGGSGQSAAAITAQPTDQSVVASTAATFTVVATDATGYQWQSSTDGGSTFVDVSGATGASYTTAVTTLGDSGTQYRVVVTGASNSVTSSAVTLTVTSVADAPAITVQPAHASVTAPAMASFSVTATGTNLSYQWQLCQDSNETCASWNNLSGAIAATYSTGSTDVSMTGQRFRVVVSNTEGSLDSAVVSLNVDPTPVAPTYQFNLFAYNAGPSAFLLYGGYVKDGADTIQCSGYTALNDPCPKWRADYASGTLLTLTATAWPGWRVSGWIGGDCGSPGNATSVTLTINHNSNCYPQFEVIPGSTFSVSVTVGVWVGLVSEVNVYGNVSDAPRINCGPYASAQICSASFEIGALTYTQLWLKAFPLLNGPVGALRWTCNSLSPEDASPVTQTAVGEYIYIGPIYGNTACSAELIPTL